MNKATLATDDGVLLAAHTLNLVYGDLTALWDFSLTLYRGEFVALTGPPACGKSSAALALLGMARSPGHFLSGQVLLAGSDMLALDHVEASALRGSEIALVTQAPRAALHPLLTVGEQLVNVLRTGTGLSKRDAREQAQRWLQRMGIQDPQARMNAYVHQLSTGMAQRVIFAMAMCREPALLVADEPTSGLDVTIQAQVLDDLAATARELGTTVLLVTQDLSLIAQYCRRVAVMVEGRIVEDRTVEDFFESPEHAYSRSVVSLTAGAPGAESAQPSDDVLLDIRGVQKTFGGDRKNPEVVALENISLQLHRGETLGLVGESGSGKTTLARCLLQLESLDAGEIRFAEQPLASPDQRNDYRNQRAAIQAVFQDPMDSMDPRWTVQEVIEEPLKRLTALDSPARQERVMGLLQRVGLPAAATIAKAVSLSAGEQQRVAVARAMATEPQFIVLDEPTSALGPQATSDLLSLLSQLQDQFGITYLFISHDLASIRNSCHRVAVLYLGQIVEEGSAKQIFEHPRHPYTRALIDADVTTSTHKNGGARTRLSGEISNAKAGGCYLAARCPFATSQCRSEAQPLVNLDDGRRLRCARALRNELPGATPPL